MRKFFLLLLMTAFWIVVFYPLWSRALDGPEAAVQPPAVQPEQARPAQRLPVPWESSQRAAVRVVGAAPAQAAQSSAIGGGAGVCGDTYRIQRGDSLGEIAKTCGVKLSDLLAANPTIKNPNRIYPGQQLVLPHPAGRGGADPLAELPSVTTSAGDGFVPGAALEVEALGLPPNARVRVGMGLTNSGYHRLADAVTDAQGSLLLTLLIPAQARSGDEAFILVTTAGTPSQQVISEVFIIGR